MFIGEGRFRVVLPDFCSSSTFPRGGRLLALFSLNHKCHVSVHDGYFLSVRMIVVGAWWIDIYVRKMEIPSFPPFLYMPPGQLPLKICGFLSVWRFLLFFACPWTPTVYKMHGFLAPGLSPLSLLICSYLPALTEWIK